MPTRNLRRANQAFLAEGWGFPSYSSYCSKVPQVRRMPRAKLPFAFTLPSLGLAHPFPNSPSPQPEKVLTDGGV